MIKRYASRRLYNTETSDYVTLEDIARFIGECDRFDMVVGARSSASQAGWHRSLANRIYNAFASYVTGRTIEDLTSGYRAMRRSVALHFVGLLPNGFSYPTTITLCMLRAGFSVAYIPIEAAKRVGKSKIRILSDGPKFLLVIMKICMLFAPLKIFLLCPLVAKPISFTRISIFPPC